ncbi:MAG TPA: polysaccharide deacetylase family protein [Candidatus Xenobia bacterium]
MSLLPLAAVIFLTSVCISVGGLLWFGFVGPLYDEAYESVQPVLVPPTMDVRQAWFGTVGDAWRLLLSTSLQDVGWMPRAQVAVPKVVALTFDDGPYPLYTPWLLALLKQEQVPATFFVIGRDAEQNPELIRRIAQDGHELANHSYTHRTMVRLSEAEVAEELRRTQDLIFRLSGVKTYIMRPPGGRINDDVLNACKLLDQTIVLWNDNPGDWQAYDPNRIHDWIFRRLPEAPMVLLHSGRLGTIHALPGIIADFRRQGFRFVTVSDYARSVHQLFPHAAGPTGLPVVSAR